jgi:hypothetical protein
MFTFEKKPLFENGTKFSDLFSNFTKRDTNPNKQNIAENSIHYGRPLKISAHITFQKNGYNFMNFVPSKELINSIQDNMLYIDRDSIYFDTVIFDNTFDVYANYNLIIGSRLIGTFNNSELPV